VCSHCGELIGDKPEPPIELEGNKIKPPSVKLHRVWWAHTKPVCPGGIKKSLVGTGKVVTGDDLEVLRAHHEKRAIWLMVWNPDLGRWEEVV
jgi:hypothetical protein